MKRKIKKASIIPLNEKYFKNNFSKEELEKIVDITKNIKIKEEKLLHEKKAQDFFQNNKNRFYKELDGSDYSLCIRKFYDLKLENGKYTIKLLEIELCNNDKNFRIDNDEIPFSSFLSYISQSEEITKREFNKIYSCFQTKVEKLSGSSTRNVLTEKV